MPNTRVLGLVCALRAAVYAVVFIGSLDALKTLMPPEESSWGGIRVSLLGEYGVDAA